MSRTLIGIIVGGVALIGIGVLLKFFYRAGSASAADETHEVDTLELRDVLAWFKQRREYLQKPGLTAVLLRVKEGQFSGSADGRLVFTQGFFNKDSAELVASRTIVARRISYELEEKFMDKDMIVFE